MSQVEGRLSWSFRSPLEDPGNPPNPTTPANPTPANPTNSPLELPAPLRSEPAKTTNRGRPVLWTPAVLSPEDTALMEEVRKKYGAKTSSKERVLFNYQIFCALNSLDPKVALMQCAAQMRISKMMWSTIDTYSGYVAQKFASFDNRDARRTIQCAHADDDVEGAPRFSRQDLRARIDLLPPEKQLIKRFCLLLLLAGIRPVAGRETRRRHFGVCGVDDEFAFVIEVHLDKTVRKRAMRQGLQVPHWLRDELASRKEITQIFGKGPPEEKPFEDVSCAQVNAALKGVTPDGEVAPTSYSFRRAYVQAVFVHTKGDGAQMKKYTLHFSDQVVKAHYVDWFHACKRDFTEADPDMMELPTDDEDEDVPDFAPSTTQK